MIHLTIVAVLTAAVMMAATFRGAWRSTGAIAALAVVGQAASLRLIEVTRYSTYQHYLPWADLVGEAPWALAVLAVQASIVSLMVWRMRRWPGWYVARGVSLPRVVLAGALLTVSLAVPTESIHRAAFEWVLAAILWLLALLTLALVAQSMTDPALEAARVRVANRLTLERRSSGEPPQQWDRAWPWMCAGLACVIAVVIGLLVLEGMPHIDDSVSNVFQAKYFSTGKLWLPAPPDSAAFHMDEVIIDGRQWFGYGFPGWPAILALGYYAGLPWLVNPLLAALAVLLTHSLVIRVAGRGTANVTTFLMAFSPWLWFMGAEYMGHMASLALVLGVALLWERVRVTGGVFTAAGAGALFGALWLTRPLDAILAGVAFAVAEVVRREKHPSLRSWVMAGTTAAAVALLLFPYNAVLTGRALYAPHMMWTDRRWGPGVDRLGFGADIGIPAWRNIDPLPGHGLIDVVLNLNKNMFALQWDLFGWAAGSIILLILAVLLARWTRRDALPISLAITVMLGHSVYWFSGGPDLGPRYWFIALPVFGWLSVRGAQALAGRWGELGVSHPGLRVGVAVVVACLSAAATFVPWRAASKYHRYRDVSGDVRRLVEAHSMQGDLVFVRSDYRPDYQSAFNLNPKTLDGPGTLFAADRGRASRSRVVARFDSRPVWVVEWVGEAPRRPAVTAGPLPPGTVPP